MPREFTERICDFFYQRTDVLANMTYLLQIFSLNEKHDVQLLDHCVICPMAIRL